MGSIFADFDLSNFWEEIDYTDESDSASYVSAPPTEALIAAVEGELGYKLPAAYIELMQHQNGGIPRNRAFPTQGSTSWANDHVAINGIFGIGREQIYSLCGQLGSQFMIDEWGYPAIGIYFADCPSGGHDMICMDYRKNGKTGEPEIIHIDRESDYEITFLAPNFETFIRGLVNDSRFDD